jgi:hypothetical protein
MRRSIKLQKYRAVRRESQRKWTDLKSKAGHQKQWSDANEALKASLLQFLCQHWTLYRFTALMFCHNKHFIASSLPKLSWIALTLFYTRDADYPLIVKHMCWFLNHTKVCLFKNAGKFAVLKFDPILRDLFQTEKTRDYHTHGISLKHMTVFFISYSYLGYLYRCWSESHTFRVVITITLISRI